MKKILIAILLLAISISCKQKEDKKPVSETDESSAQLYHNGDILTMAAEKPTYAEAIVEEDGKIAFVGSQKEAEEKYTNAKKIDLKGKTMLPGFIDPHSHFGMVSNTMGQVDLNSPPVGEVKTIANVLQKMEAYKTDNNLPDGEWIFGWGYDESQLKEKRHLHKKEIDSVLPNNPVYLVHTSGHMGVANSKALEKMNISAATKNPEGGSIARLPNSKEPAGLVQETAMYPFMGTMMQILQKKQADSLKARKINMQVMESLPHKMG